MPWAECEAIVCSYSVHCHQVLYFGSRIPFYGNVHLAIEPPTGNDPWHLQTPTTTNTGNITPRGRVNNACPQQPDWEEVAESDRPCSMSTIVTVFDITRSMIE
jgi:hypothetical protein